jgi:hypothetical protein
VIDRNKRSNISMNDTIRIKKVLISMTLVGSLLMSGSVVSATDLSASEVIDPASAVQQKANVTIDGVKQVFPQSAVVIGGSTLVPMRAIFEKLGATLKWDNNSQTATATKGDKTISITIGKENAFVNGRSVQLAAKALLVNGNTMVPLRFVSEALGGSVTWDANTNTTHIVSAGGVVQAPVESGTKVGNIAVKYGKHDYGSKNQAEYDKVMAIVGKALQDGSNIKLPEYYAKYIDGDKASNYEYYSDPNVELTVAEGQIGALVKAGLSKVDIEKAYKAMTISSNLIRGLQDPGTGAPRSAYDALVNRVTDCDSDAHVFSAVYDSLGLNSVIIAGTSHADPFIKLGSNWYKISAGKFTLANLSSMPSSLTIVSQPTFGPKLNR